MRLVFIFYFVPEFSRTEDGWPVSSSGWDIRYTLETPMGPHSRIWR